MQPTPDFVSFDDEQAAAFAASFPPADYYFELIERRAQEQGQLALEVWRCLLGPKLGAKTLWSPNKVATHLGLPQSTVDRITEETMEVVKPIWLASEQYRACRAAREKLWRETGAGPPTSTP